VQVNQATATSLNYGQTLACATVSGGSVTGVSDAALTGTWNWSVSTTTPPAGTSSYAVTFTPNLTGGIQTDLAPAKRPPYSAHVTRWLV
jgi:hypothetical protein